MMRTFLTELLAAANGRVAIVVKLILPCPRNEAYKPLMSFVRSSSYPHRKMLISRYKIPYYLDWAEE